MKSDIFMEKSEKIIKKNTSELIDTLTSLNESYYSQLVKVSSLIASRLANQATIFLCGNGGSASDCQHFSSELVGKFKNERVPLKAISLTTDTSILTNIANDFSYELVFSRQLQALSKEGDILISISTSGSSKNILNAIFEAKKRKVITISLLGKSGGQALEMSDYSLLVPSFSTARIQEVHALTEHIICELIEEHFGFS